MRDTMTDTAPGGLVVDIEQAEVLEATADALLEGTESFTERSAEASGRIRAVRPVEEGCTSVCPGCAGQR